MRKIIVTQKQRGFLFCNGKYVKMLDSGKYYIFGRQQVEISSINSELDSRFSALETILSDENVKRRVAVTEVGDQQYVLHFVNGNFSDILTEKRKYAFWNDIDSHEFRTIDISTPEIGDDVPKYIIESLPEYLYEKVEVAEYQKARLYYDNRLVKVLDAGTYYFWNCGVRIDVGYVDTRLMKMDISGQEILTQDKVTLRINFVCSYKITDYVKILTEIDDYEEQLHIAAQLALRDYIGKYRLDEILANKSEISEYVFNRLKEKESELYIEIKDAGIKDIILPGEIREIMNTVLIAEKSAQAGVITRREEVASTRSLLNTARLMEENPTLYKLKELEYVERICHNVGNINLSGNCDMISQLLGLINTEGHKARK